MEVNTVFHSIQAFQILDKLLSIVAIVAIVCSVLFAQPTHFVKLSQQNVVARGDRMISK
ncbi:MAG: hypothetical protein JWM11_3829 [Planctomycetaceae bacterium]|nr:hypothetical protein [Planctomycetaceae bacterium]